MAEQRRLGLRLAARAGAWVGAGAGALTGMEVDLVSRVWAEVLDRWSSSCWSSGCRLGLGLGLGLRLGLGLGLGLGRGSSAFLCSSSCVYRLFFLLCWFKCRWIVRCGPVLLISLILGLCVGASR